MKKLWHTTLLILCTIIGAEGLHAQQCSVIFKVKGKLDDVLSYPCSTTVANTPNTITDQRYRPDPDSCNKDHNGNYTSLDVNWYITDSMPSKYIRWNFADTIKTNITLTALYEPDIRPLPGHTMPYPNPDDIVLTYGTSVINPGIFLTFGSIGIPSIIGKFMDNIYPRVNDSRNTPYRYRMIPMDPADDVCVSSRDTTLMLTVLPKEVSVNAAPAIFVMNSAGELSPQTGTSIDEYVSKRYKVETLAPMDDENSAFTTGHKPIAELAHATSYYNHTGEYPNEVVIKSPPPQLNNNYTLNTIHKKNSVWVTKINWRDYREQVTYGDTLLINATYSGAATTTNLLICSSSNSQTIGISGKVGSYTAEIKGTGNTIIKFRYANNDSIKYPITVLPAPGLTITIPHDTAPKYDPSILQKYVVTGLKYNDKIDEYAEVVVKGNSTTDTAVLNHLRDGTYPIVIKTINNRNYTNVTYNHGSITIFKVGDSIQDVRYIRNPSSNVRVNNPSTMVVWAKAVGNAVGYPDPSRPLRYSSNNPTAVSILKDTAGFDDDGTTPLWGAVLKINNIGDATIRAYQRGDSIYRDTFALHTITVAQGNQRLYVEQALDTMNAGTRVLLTNYFKSTSGVPIVFSVNSMNGIARISGDTLYALRRGEVQLTIILPSHPNYTNSDTMRRTIIVVSTYFEISVQGEWLIPPFHDTTKIYTLLLPCPNNNGGMQYATIVINYDSDADSLYCNGVGMDGRTVRISDTTSTKQLVFTLRRSGVLRGTYTINLERRIPGVVGQLWDNSPVLALLIERIENPPLNENRLGYKINSYQWYYSVSSISQRYPLSGANAPYLELSKIPYKTGTYSVYMIDTGGMLRSVCPFQWIERAAASRMAAYPNPVRGNITIDNPDWETSGGIYLYDYNGTLRRHYVASGSTQVLDVSGLESGLYLLRVGTQVIRITIQTGGNR